MGCRAVLRGPRVAAGLARRRRLARTIRGVPVPLRRPSETRANRNRVQPLLSLISYRGFNVSVSSKTARPRGRYGPIADSRPIAHKGGALSERNESPGAKVPAYYELSKQCGFGYIHAQDTAFTERFFNSPQWCWHSRSLPSKVRSRLLRLWIQSCCIDPSNRRLQLSRRRTWLFDFEAMQRYNECATSMRRCS